MSKFDKCVANVILNWLSVKIECGEKDQIVYLYTKTKLSKFILNFKF